MCEQSCISILKNRCKWKVQRETVRHFMWKRVQVSEYVTFVFQRRFFLFKFHANLSRLIKIELFPFY